MGNCGCNQQRLNENIDIIREEIDALKELQFRIHSSIIGELRVLGAELKNKPVTVGPAVVPTTVDYDLPFRQIAEPMAGQPIEFLT